MATYSGRLGPNGRGGWTLWIALLTWLTAASPLPAQMYYDQFDDYDLMMQERPKLSWIVERKIEFADGLKELWGRALDRPDAELQRLVIDTLAIAQQRGVEGLDELKPRLVEMAKKPDQPLDVVRALTQTLIAFDARDQASLLADLAKQHGAPIGQIVEPALAKWKSPELEQTWLARVNGPAAGNAMMILAIDGLVGIESERASEPLTKIVRNVGQSAQLRMAAARGLGELHDAGLVDLASDLVSLQSQPAELHPILAAQLLSRHSDPQAIELLTSMLDRDSTVVQSEALQQLYRIDSKLVDQQRERIVNSSDVNVRRWCLQSLVEMQQADRLALICQLLDDVNPTLRRQAASSLVTLAEDAGLRDAVIEETSKVLEQSNWRGCEQACVVLTRLDHKPSSERMIELLAHDRGEVQVAAAWGLSKLRVPERLPEMLDHAERVYEGFRSEEFNDGMPGKSLHVAHLFQAFGDQRYAPAEALMRQYMPKDHSLGLESRAAAAWALGLLHEGDPDPELISIFVGRLYDNQIDPDTDILRDMCAVALGNMKAEAALPDLRKLATAGMPSCYWAIEQMTGEKPPQPGSDLQTIDDWFLSPIRLED